MIPSRNYRGTLKWMCVAQALLLVLSAALFLALSGLEYNPYFTALVCGPYLLGIATTLIAPHPIFPFLWCAFTAPALLFEALLLSQPKDEVGYALAAPLFLHLTAAAVLLVATGFSRAVVGLARFCRSAHSFRDWNRS